MANCTGGSPITYYEIRYKANAGDTYTALITSAVGKVLYFDHKLTGTAFPSNQNVYYTICAQNIIGMGACSADFTVVTNSVPLSMVQPTLYGSVKPF